MLDEAGNAGISMSGSRNRVVERISADGFAFLSGADAQAALQVDLPQLGRLQVSWSTLPRDTYLRDGGHYRARRHSCYIQSFSPPGLQAVPHRAHWQSTSYNALHGGIERWFEPIEPRVAADPVWLQLLGTIGELFASVRNAERWFIEAHQFRIDTKGGIGRPTPEGAHRDGVDFVAVILVQRSGIRGGETHVFDANASAGLRFTMVEPFSMLLMDDTRVIHETTPVQPQQDGILGTRDTLVLTYRAGAFQAPR
jgi:hypothetical protein